MTSRPSRLASRAHDRVPDRWMVSYVDVLTILLIFFLSVAANKFKAPVPVIADTVKPANVKPEPQLAKVPEPTPLEQVEQKLKAEDLNLKLDPRGLTISLPQAVLFSPGDDKIHAEALPTLEKIAEAIRDTPNHVNLAGYADATPIHSARFQNNWDLAAARGLRLMELLTKKYDLDESRFSVSSYGSNDPKSPNDTEDGRANNRRVEILLLSEPVR